ncbi:MAG TPA: hypothetical protein VFL41_09400 [Gaiellaceae bacterium]|nr:hypothetical protein [Gaiellaceae bacterium]
MTSAETAFLADLERALAHDEADEPDAVLMLLAGREVPLEEDELRGPRRRAVQLLATGGDPRQGLDVDGRAVGALAADIDRPDRREALAQGLEALRERAEGFPHVLDRVTRLRADEELAWRWFACTVLAEELLGE